MATERSEVEAQRVGPPIVRRGRWELLCSSESQGVLCDKPFGHKGVHRSWEGSGSWGTAAELAETLEVGT